MIKIVAVFIYTFLVRFFCYTTLAIGLMDYHYIFPFFILMILLPELCFVLVPSFRKWIKDGVEDGDNILNKSDLSALITHYATLWCIRLFVVFGLLEAFYGIEVREIFVIGSLSGAFGIESVSLISRFIPNKKQNDN